MTFEDIWKIVATAVASVGGIGVIITVIVKFCSNIIADKLSQKYELKMDKELEKFKTELNKKEYVSKTKFDAEFKIYRELSLAFADMIKSINLLVPIYARVPADKEERLEYEKKCYKKSISAIAKAQDTLNSNIPFISEKIYDKYDELLRLSTLQIDEYEERFDVFNLRPQELKEKFSSDAYKRTREINNEWKVLNDIIRAYLAKLDVAE